MDASSQKVSVRIAVVGAGLIGRKHVAILRSGSSNYSLAGVVDPSPQAKQEAKQHGYACFEELEEMLDRSRPDGVVIAVPNQLHTPVGLGCIARNLPALVEKPIADSISSAMELVRAAAEARVPILVGHHRRHNPLLQRAAELIGEGRLGKIVAVNSLWLAHKPKDYFQVAWRSQPGGGPILINAIHDVDCLRMLCGDVASVHSIASHAVRSFSVEDSAAAVLQFKNGAIGTLLVSDCVSSPWSWEWTSRENPYYPFEPEDCYLIAGTQGSLAIPSMLLRWHKAGEESWGTPLSASRTEVASHDPLVAQLEHFARVIRGEETPILDGLNGTITLATTLAIGESAATGKPVFIDELMNR